MKYRRTQGAGGVCFFPVDLAGRSRTLLVDYVARLRAAIMETKVKSGFPKEILRLSLLAPALWLVLSNAHAQVSLPNGTHSEMIRDLKV